MTDGIAPKAQGCAGDRSKRAGRRIGCRGKATLAAAALLAREAEAVLQPQFDAVDVVTEVINRVEAALDEARAEGGNKAHSLAPNLQPAAISS